MDTATDRRYRTDGRKARVLHVPLTDDEFQSLRRMAFETGGTIGDLASVGTRHVLKKANPANKEK